MDAHPIFRGRTRRLPAFDLRLDGEEDHVPLGRLEHRASEQVEEVFVGEVGVHGARSLRSPGVGGSWFVVRVKPSFQPSVLFFNALRNRGARNCHGHAWENAGTREKSVGLLRACRLCLPLLCSHAYRPGVARETKMRLRMAMSLMMATSKVRPQTPNPKPQTPGERSEPK